MSVVILHSSSRVCSSSKRLDRFARSLTHSLTSRSLQACLDHAAPSTVGNNGFPRGNAGGVLAAHDVGEDGQGGDRVDFGQVGFGQNLSFLRRAKRGAFLMKQGGSE